MLSPASFGEMLTLFFFSNLEYPDLRRCNPLLLKHAGTGWSEFWIIR
jgi:hypothetical protein